MNSFHFHFGFFRSIWIYRNDFTRFTRLAQSADRKSLNHVVVSAIPILIFVLPTRHVHQHACTIGRSRYYFACYRINFRARFRTVSTSVDTQLVNRGPNNKYPPGIISFVHWVELQLGFISCERGSIPRASSSHEFRFHYQVWSSLLNFFKNPTNLYRIFEQKIFSRYNLMILLKILDLQSEFISLWIVIPRIETSKADSALFERFRVVNTCSICINSMISITLES